MKGEKKSLSNREISVIYHLGLVQYMLQAQGEVMVIESYWKIREKLTWTSTMNKILHQRNAGLVTDY